MGIWIGGFVERARNHLFGIVGLVGEVDCCWNLDFHF